MPNWVQNTVKAENWETLKSVVTKLEQGKRVIDFNKVKPCPFDKELIEDGEWIEENEYFKNAEQEERQNTEIKPFLDSVYNETMTQNDFVAVVNRNNKVEGKIISIFKLNKFPQDRIKNEINSVIRGYYNYRKYGHVNAYNFCIHEWGTKWNACDGISDEKSKTLSFQTAWDMPDNIYREISKFTPIVVAYADENTGNNYGVVAYKDGQETVILDDKNESAGESLACGFEDLENYISNIYCDYTDEEVQEIFKTSKEKFLAKVSEDFEQTSKTISELF